MYILKLGNAKIFKISENAAIAIKKYGKLEKGWYKIEVRTYVGNKKNCEYTIEQCKLLKSTNFEVGKKYKNLKEVTIFVGDDKTIYPRGVYKVLPVWIEGLYPTFNYENRAFVYVDNDKRYYYLVLGNDPYIKSARNFSDAVKKIIADLTEEYESDANLYKNKFEELKDEVKALTNKLSKLSKLS